MGRRIVFSLTQKGRSNIFIQDVNNKNKFQITKIKYSLYIPPNYINLMLKYSNNIDIFFSKLFFGFGGVLIVEAKKEIYGFQSPQTSKNKKLTKLVTIPAKAMRVL